MCACRRRSQSAIKIPFAVRKLQSGIKPYKTVESFQTQSHSTLSLLEALDDLNGILNSFTEAIGAPTEWTCLLSVFLYYDAAMPVQSSKR
jgi:hypothetical protein